MPTRLRIFLSSPGDVIPERRRAKLVIEKLAKTYARFFSIEAVLWEVEPMLASGHFQDQITTPSETDIVVLIVWSRLGTPLPLETSTRAYHGIDGRVPVTGTEWEFEDALAAQKIRGAPDLLAYRKQVDPTVSLRDRSAKAAAEEQWEKLDGFWNRWFVNRGEFRAAFAEFSNLDGFEAKLESDLARLLERRIAAPQSPGGGAVPTATWLAGSPFRGLESYRFEHAPIFFGRSAITRLAVEQLTANAEAGRAFLLILGASGAGKSSLAQAGVLPALTGKGIVPRVGLWRRALMRPSGHPQGPFAALAQALVETNALPELLAGNQSSEALARHLKVAADDPSFPLVAALNTIEQKARAQGDLLAIEKAYLAIVVDQLEELFTLDSSRDERTAFVRCLAALAQCGRIHVIATLRSDYWHRAAETPLLVDIAAGSGRIDVLAPRRDEIMEMIRQPAQAAGLQFESDPSRDIRLDATLASEASDEPGVLPLLSFLLDEVYKRDVERGHKTTLTYTSVQELGGLTGAIASRAETIFAVLPPAAQAALAKVLRALVTVSGTGAQPTARAMPADMFNKDPEARQLTDALIDPAARLLVAEGDGERAQIRLAHEALITRWQRASDQITRDRDDLRTRAMIEQAYIDWRDAKAPDKRGLLLHDPQLASALDLAKRWPEDLDKRMTSFVETSGRQARLKARLTLAASIAFCFLGSAAALASLVAYRAAQAEKAAVALYKSENARADRAEAYRPDLQIVQFKHFYDSKIESLLTDHREPEEAKKSIMDGFRILNAEDVNLDGALDFIVFNDSMWMCGTGGCAMELYRADQIGKTYTKILDLFGHNDIRVSASITNGYRDVVARQRTNFVGGAPIRSVFKWSGKEYTLSHYSHAGGDFEYVESQLSDERYIVDPIDYSLHDRFIIVDSNDFFDAPSTKATRVKAPGYGSNSPWIGGKTRNGEWYLVFGYKTHSAFTPASNVKLVP